MIGGIKKGCEMIFIFEKFEYIDRFIYLVIIVAIYYVIFFNVENVVMSKIDNIFFFLGFIF